MIDDNTEDSFGPTHDALTSVAAINHRLCTVLENHLSTLGAAYVKKLIESRDAPLADHGSYETLCQSYTQNKLILTGVILADIVLHDNPSKWWDEATEGQVSQLIQNSRLMSAGLILEQLGL